MLSHYQYLLLVSVTSTLANDGHTSTGRHGEGNDATRCRTSFNPELKAFEVLPGSGWDNLQNEPMGQVALFTYSTCKVTEDNNYIIPDQILVQPLKESSVDKFAQVIRTMSDYSSLTAKSINKKVSINLFIVSVTYSSEYRKNQLHKMKQRGMSSTFRVQARYLRYRSQLDQGFPLHPNFRSRVLKVAQNILLGNSKMADFLSQLMIRDYGTHVVMSSDAGGLIVKDDEIRFSSEQDRESESQSLKVSAAFHLNLLFFHLDTGFENSKSTSHDAINNYLSRVQNTDIKTIGGPSFGFQNFSIADWISGLDNNLATLDRRGEPLYNLVTKNNFPELPMSLIPDVQNTLRRAYEVYFKQNTYYGCTDMTSDYFNARANADDNTCKPISDLRFPFGGVYRVCDTLESDDESTDLCVSLRSSNHLTGNAGCPRDSQPMLFHESHVHTERWERQCWTFFWIRYSCSDVKHVRTARVRSYWCSYTSVYSLLDVEGFKFGGVFSNFRVNPATNGQSCPGGYMSTIIADDVTFCYTNDKTLPDPGLYFGGIFSCHYGNSIANGSSKCPDGYSQHLITSDEECDAIVCMKYKIKFGINQPLPNLQKPPFMKQPPETERPKKHRRVIIDSQNTWYKNKQAFSKVEEVSQDRNLMRKVSDFITASARFQKLANMTSIAFDSTILSGNRPNVNHGDMSALSVVIVSSATTAFCILGAYMAFFLFKQVR